MLFQCQNVLMKQLFYFFVLQVDAQDPDGHQRDLEPQITQCFACPSCYLLFNLRDECLQHMAKTNHFLQRHKLSGEQGTRCPLPFPNYAKKLLISLCQEVPFQVKCTACRQMLRTHVELTAHFRTRCRRAGPVAVSAKDISQVAAIFKVRGCCLDCSKLFVDDNQINQHTQRTMHNIQWIRTMEKAILAFCHFNEKSKTPSDLRLILDQSKAKKHTLFKRPLAETCGSEAAAPTSSKRTRRECNNVQVKEEKVECENRLAVSQWFCECHQRFDSEEAVEKHVMAANGIRHKCLVCGKLAFDAGIIGLHMSRSHGGAHLTNYRLWCGSCRTEMLRKQDLMAHIVESHSGHAYYYEKQVDKDQLMAFESPSFKSAGSSADSGGKGGEGMQLDANSPEAEAAPQADGSWQCRLCEEMFDSEESVAQHCGCLANHQFHKYSCGLCKKHFHRVETLYRHSRDEHSNELSVKYFCGLCDDIEFNSEGEFLEHYKVFHSTDYVFVEHGDTATEKEVEEDSAEEHSLMACGCRQQYNSKISRKEGGHRCLKNLFDQGKLWFRCSCSATAQSEEDAQSHMLECHGATETGSSSFTVKCICGKAFIDGKSAQMHYHSKHCTSQEGGPAPSSSTDVEAAAPHVAALCSSPKEAPRDNDTKASTSHEAFPATAVEKDATNHEEDIELPDLDLLRTMTHLVFIDLDNWAGFFNHLPGHLNQGTFFWGFQGGKNHWKPPENCPVYNFLVNTGCFFLHPRCSTRKDAADFAICMHAGRMDEQLPKHIPFTVLSGDKGFEELKNQLKKTMRPGHILNPHQMEGELMCALLNSISDIGKDSDDEDEVLQKTLTLSLQEEKQRTAHEDATIEDAILRSLEEQ
ncbi:E3 SUMO-protein ligase ZNF451-like [Mustelus asterias]